MKNKKNRIILLCVIVIVIVIGAFIYKISNKNESTGSTSTTDIIDSKINTDDGDNKINWSQYTDNDYELKDSLTITKGGIYNLTGTIKNGSITINTTENVKLNLNNVNITNSSGPAIYVESAENTIINLVEGSKNVLTDGTTYEGYTEDVQATLYSCDDLVIEGTGSLIVNANNQDGIVSKDDLKIINGNYEINSVDDGIRGKDSLYILNGTYVINSGADALKSTNDTDSEKGFILIEKGTFNINAEEDGLQAETKIVIEDGVFNITTGGGSNNSSDKSNWGYWGNSSTTSAKGLKSVDNLVINNGTFKLNTSDDAIHSNNYVGIKNGNFDISSGDDGIHADKEIIIDNGTINIAKSYEGIESAKVTINNGNINLVATDDGINIAGGNDSSSMNRPGANNYSKNTDNILTINNGKIYVNASGDGIDINGIGYINGGNIIVDGPTGNGNGILDYDNGLIVTAGQIIAAGSSEMFQGLTSGTKIYNVNIYFNSNISSNTKITIIDSANNEVISYTSSKVINAMLIGSDKFTKNTKYTIKVDGEEYETFETSSITTAIGNNYGGGTGGRPNGGGRQNYR